MLLATLIIDVVPIAGPLPASVLTSLLGGVTRGKLAAHGASKPSFPGVFKSLTPTETANCSKAPSLRDLPEPVVAQGAFPSGSHPNCEILPLVSQDLQTVSKQVNKQSEAVKRPLCFSKGAPGQRRQLRRDRIKLLLEALKFECLSPCSHPSVLTSRTISALSANENRQAMTD